MEVGSKRTVPLLRWCKILPLLHAKLKTLPANQLKVILLIFFMLLFSGIFRNMKRGGPEDTFQMYVNYVFQSVQILVYFFTLNISTIYHLQGDGAGARPPKYAPMLLLHWTKFDTTIEM